MRLVSVGFDGRYNGARDAREQLLLRRYFASFPAGSRVRCEFWPWSRCPFGEQSRTHVRSGDKPLIVAKWKPWRHWVIFLPTS